MTAQSEMLETSSCLPGDIPRVIPDINAFIRVRPSDRRDGRSCRSSSNTLGSLRAREDRGSFLVEAYGWHDFFGEHSTSELKIKRVIFKRIKKRIKNRGFHLSQNDENGYNFNIVSHLFDILRYDFSNEPLPVPQYINSRDDVCRLLYVVHFCKCTSCRVSRKKALVKAFP